MVFKCFNDFFCLTGKYLITKAMSNSEWLLPAVKLQEAFWNDSLGNHFPTNIVLLMETVTSLSLLCKSTNRKQMKNNLFHYSSIVKTTLIITNPHCDSSIQFPLIRSICFLSGNLDYYFFISSLLPTARQY